MNRDDVKKLLLVIQALYPNWKPDDMKLTLDAWFVMIQDRDNGVMQRALKWHTEADTSGFAPTVGQLLDRYRRLTEGETISASEAWAKVRYAISNSAYYAEREFRELPEAVQKAVGSPDALRAWAMTDRDNMGFVQAQFNKNFQAVIDRGREYAVMDKALFAEIEAKRQELLEAPEPEEELKVSEDEDKEELKFYPVSELDRTGNRIAEMKKRFLGGNDGTGKLDNQ